MICGTFVFEDQSLQWRLKELDVVEYTVADGLNGGCETVTCTWAGFAAAMTLAIAGDEIVAATQLYAIAEPAMPKEPTLRWIP